MNDKNNAKLLLNTILESTGELNISSFIYFISFYISVNNNDLIIWDGLPILNSAVTFVFKK